MTELTYEQSHSPFKRALGNRNFRLLWLGEGISLLGDQFYLLALPWLVLQITEDAFAVGGVLAVASIPRALFMLIGGALTDRISPREVMLGSNLIRMTAKSQGNGARHVTNFSSGTPFHLACTISGSGA